MSDEFNGHDPSNDDMQRALDAATIAEHTGWYTIIAAVLIAINPDDSSEVWTFYHAEQQWKRKGEPPRRQLRHL